MLQLLWYAQGQVSGGGAGGRAEAPSGPSRQSLARKGSLYTPDEAPHVAARRMAWIFNRENKTKCFCEYRKKDYMRLVWFFFHGERETKRKSVFASISGKPNIMFCIILCRIYYIVAIFIFCKFLEGNMLIVGKTITKRLQVSRGWDVWATLNQAMIPAHWMAGQFFT